MQSICVSEKMLAVAGCMVELEREEEQSQPWALETDLSQCSSDRLYE